MSSSKGWPLVILFFSVALLGSILHCSLLATIGAWTAALSGLYFLPVVIAAINLGYRAAVGVALASGGAHAVAAALGCSDRWLFPAAETILFLCVGLTASRLSRIHGHFSAVQPALPRPSTDERLVGAFQGPQAGRTSPALSEIAAGLIRRFRTPVSSIEGAAWLLEDSRCPPEKREEFVGIIRKETHQLDRALSDILEFSQPRKPGLVRADLSGIFDRVIQQAKLRDHSPFLLFRKDIPADFPPLTCDPEMITKMIQNLAVNAMQAAPNGGQIWLKAAIEGGTAVISVKDPGRGIAPAVAERIFEPFFTTRESGLGLGLTVARQIAVAHGGTITVSNTAEKGTVVTVALPLNPPETDEHGTDTRS